MNSKVKQNELRDLITRQDYKCALTGLELEPETASADHILPVSKGGLNSIDNIQILHHEVNRAKSAMTNQEFIQMCKNVVNWTERKKPDARQPLENQKVLF